MAKSPTPVRLSEDDEIALSKLPGSRSDILRRGIHLQAAAEAAMVPLYAHDVGEPSIQAHIEAAAELATKHLDELFPGTPPERGGISSNFQGLLVEHLTAMLTGREFSKQSYSRALTPLFGDWRTFGRPPLAQAQEGFTLLAVPARIDGEQQFYDDDEKKFVPLTKVSAGALFTSGERAVNAGFEWLRSQGLSPREMPLRLCVLNFAKDGPPTVAHIAEL